jgi:hypothetical protein
MPEVLKPEGLVVAAGGVWSSELVAAGAGADAGVGAGVGIGDGVGAGIGAGAGAGVTAGAVGVKVGAGVIAGTDAGTDAGTTTGTDDGIFLGPQAGAVAVGAGNSVLVIGAGRALGPDTGLLGRGRGAGATAPSGGAIRL